MRRYLLIGLLAVLGAAVGLQSSAFSAPYNGIQAGLDSYYYGEAQRREQLDRQLYGNDQLQRWRGTGYPANANVYVAQRRGLFGRTRQRVYYVPRTNYAPGPYAPAEVAGTVDTARVPQSIGQRQMQTGPNRWESHPVYEEPERRAEYFRRDEPVLREEREESVRREEPVRREQSVRREVPVRRDERLLRAEPVREQRRYREAEEVEREERLLGAEPVREQRRYREEEEVEREERLPVEEISPFDAPVVDELERSSAREF